MSLIGRFLARSSPVLLKNVQGQAGFTRHIAISAPVAASAKVREPAPSFQGVAVLNKEFKNISLADYKGKYLLLFFYPMDFTFVCPTEIWSFSDRLKEFKDLQTEVVGVSVDSQFSHLAWINTDRKEGGLGDIKYPLLADITKSVSSDYGVLLEKDGISLRGTFIIDGNGILRHISVNDLPVGRSVDEYLRLIKAFQYSDKHGEVCPANWHPEKNPDTINPDVDKSKKYFSNQ